MIFNLNEQKVLSDPSGSSVFKGEKDFNDIVVNLPDNIDGHTATELNYVMHFVDSDGGYSTKVLTVDSSGETLKATATVSTSITSKAQAFYAYVLMTDDEETVIGKTNGVIVMIHPVPDEENEIIPPADADKIIKGLEEIVQEATETIETATDTIEEATEAISSKQDKLTAGENITIDENNVISAESGSNDYTDLTNKPSINNVTLSGNKTSDDLSLQGKLTAGNNITINNGVISASGGVTSYEDLTDKPMIDGNSISGNIELSQGLRFNYRPEYGYRQLSTDTTNLLNKIVGLTNGVYNRSNIFGFQTRQVIKNFLPNDKRSVVFQFYTNDQYNDEHGTHHSTDLQLYIDFSIETGEMFFRTVSQTDNQEVVYGDWEKINKTIVSGVVNANGTITFTDSGGNTFTTSGSSVIGADGFSPVATVTQTASGATVSITDSTGTTTANISNGQDGNDYILTAQDKSDIADIVLSELPNADTMSF